MSSQDEPFARAGTFESEGVFGLALLEYENAIRKGIGDQAIAHQGKGRALMRLGRLEEAIRECRKALEVNPNLPLAHSVLGYIHLEQADYDLAMRELLTALRLEPNDVIAMTNLVYTYSAQGRHDEATRMCEEVVRRQPRDGDSRLLLADLYLRQSRFRDSVKQLNKAWVVSPARPRVYLYYAAVLVGIVFRYSTRLGGIARAAISAGLYLIALFAPPFVSIPVGVLLLAFGVILALVYRRFYSYEGTGVSKVVLFSLYFLSCIAYWGLVLLHPRLVASLGA